VSGAHHRPGPGGLGADHPDRQAVRDRTAVEETLDIAGVEGEPIGHALVANEHAAALGEQRRARRRRSTMLSAIACPV
jgi:hypothetical protein